MIEKLNRKKVIFWGATGQAKMLYESLPIDVELIAIIDNNKNIISPFHSIPLYDGSTGWGKWLESIENKQELYYAVAIGGARGKERIEISDLLEKAGMQPLTIQDMSAYVATTVRLGKAVQILPQAAVCTEVTLGDLSIINTGATIDHECTIGKGVHICPGSHLAGLVQVNDYATIYTGAIVMPRICIGEGAIVGAGAVVTKDVKPYTVVMGNPAREKTGGE